jgi:hypothetical protein
MARQGAHAVGACRRFDAAKQAITELDGVRGTAVREDPDGFETRSSVNYIEHCLHIEHGPKVRSDRDLSLLDPSGVDSFKPRAAYGTRLG